MDSTLLVLSGYFRTYFILIQLSQDAKISIKDLIAIKNLFGAKLRTSLNVFVTSISFFLVIFISGMYDGMREYAKNITIETEVAGGTYWHPGYDSMDPRTFEDSHSIIPNQIKKLIYPNSVIITKYNNHKISDDFIRSVIIFIFSFLFIFLIIAMLLSISGLDFVTSISGAASSISNVGPGLGEIIGPDGNYKTLPDLSKWILATGMLLGRLELFAVLVLFFPSFWRN